MNDTSFRPAAPATAPVAARVRARLGDFTTGPRVLTIAALAIVVGSAAVGCAWVLLRLIALATSIAYFGRVTVQQLAPGASPLGAWSVLVPIAGGIIVGLLARFGSEKIRGHGIPEAMEAILIGRSRMEARVAILKPLASAIAIGTGGPFGAEGPIIMSGGAIGSLLAQALPVTAAERKTLLVAGAAAGMAAVFNTPMAALLLAVELLLFEWKPRSVIPVAVAVAVAALERPLLIGSGALFPFSFIPGLTGADAGGWVAIGLAMGLGSGLLTAMCYAAEDGFAHLPVHWMWWPAIGGLVVGLGGLVSPAALGVGYLNIGAMLDGALAGHAALLLLVVKAVIWSIALGSGTSGGVLAPLLIMGGAAGALFGSVVPGASVPFCALLGMASMMGGTMRAPLTATIFALELTHDVSALLPVLVACTVSFATTVLLLKRSILTEKVARRGHHLSREYSVDPFALARVGAVMVPNVDTLPATMPVADALTLATTGAWHHKSYPVIEQTGALAGLVSRADILRWQRETEASGRTLRDMVSGRDTMTAAPDEMVSDVMDRMAEGDIGRVPVVEGGKLVGLLSRKDLFKVRATLGLAEREREAFIGRRQ
jgi:H+/Cl- antiporter ClcA